MRRVLGAVALLVVFANGGYPDVPSRLRVLTYNIHHGEGTDGQFDLGRIAEVMLSAQPDLVALQERAAGRGRHAEFILHDDAFHRVISELSGYERLWPTINRSKAASISISVPGSRLEVASSRTSTAGSTSAARDSATN